MQKMTALSNNLGGEAPKNDVFLQVKRFFGRKTNAPIDFLAKNE